jgi:hypothetical protein
MSKAAQRRGRRLPATAEPRSRRRARSCSRSTARHAPAQRRPGSQEHAPRIDLLGRIEVEVARIERAMDPPLV